jgi:hypothetical protein
MINCFSDQQSAILKLVENLAIPNKQSAAAYLDRLTDLRADLLRETEGHITEAHSKALALEKEIQQTQDQFNSILESLCFTNLKIRHLEIKEAHEKTFKWIFDKSLTNFVEWMKTSNGIFWISGKAGSGKSTLMKFIGQHPQTGNETLYTASHYFWSPGTKKQKSQEGLFQTLLYQILSQCPLLIPIVCPSRFKHRNTYELWSRTELLLSFDRLLSHTSLTHVKFCFFIDGLDEYDGDHLELTQLLGKFAATSSIKLCVSSRPWNDFVFAYKGNKFQLAVQDFTKDDIRSYVKDELMRHPIYQKLEKSDLQYSNLVHHIIDKAQGVFLWVFLVVRSALRGFPTMMIFLSSNRELTSFQRIWRSTFSTFCKGLTRYIKSNHLGSS